MGNSVVVIPSEKNPLAATDFYQVLDTSDVPPGVVNIVTGKRDSLVETLAAHDDVSSLWYWGTREGCAMVERLSAGNMKRTWVHSETNYALDALSSTDVHEYLREATQVKNIWVPYGA